MPLAVEFATLFRQQKICARLSRISVQYMGIHDHRLTTDAVEKRSGDFKVRGSTS